MNEFDFLRKHGYGVVYGEKAVRQKIIDLAIKSPKKERTMTYEQATADLELVEAGVAEVAASVDIDGNLVKIDGEATEEVGFVTDEGVVATPADVVLH